MSATRLLLLLLLATPLLAQQGKDESIAAFNELNKELQTATQKFYADYAEARKKDPATPFDFSKHPNHTFAPRFEAFAKKWDGTGGAVRALTTLLRNAATEEGKKAALAGLLSEKHVVLPQIVGALFNIRYARWADRVETLRTIAEKNPDDKVKGNALLQIGWVLKYTDPKQALEYLHRAKKEYGAQSYSGKRTVADQADAEMFEINHLSVGKQAPDIVGEDIDGVPMKLSDFRGKVVFLDFWGDW